MSPYFNSGASREFELVSLKGAFNLFVDILGLSKIVTSVCTEKILHLRYFKDFLAFLIEDLVDRRGELTNSLHLLVDQLLVLTCFVGWDV